MNAWILMRIGCIECGCPSEVVGLYTNEQLANSEAKRLKGDEKFTWMDGGQNYYEVFLLPGLDTFPEKFQ